MSEKLKSVGFVTVEDGRIRITDGRGHEDAPGWPAKDWQTGDLIISGIDSKGDYEVLIERDRQHGPVIRIVIELKEEINKGGD